MQVLRPYHQNHRDLYPDRYFVPNRRSWAPPWLWALLVMALLFVLGSNFIPDDKQTGARSPEEQEAHASAKNETAERTNTAQAYYVILQEADQLFKAQQYQENFQVSFDRSIHIARHTRQERYACLLGPFIDLQSAQDFLRNQRLELSIIFWPNPNWQI